MKNLLSVLAFLSATGASATDVPFISNLSHCQEEISDAAISAIISDLKLKFPKMEKHQCYADAIKSPAAYDSQNYGFGSATVFCWPSKITEVKVLVKRASGRCFADHRHVSVVREIQ